MESLHPLIVHFPIALLLTAVGVDGLALLLKRPSLHRLALWNLSLGVLGAAAAVVSGLQAEVVGKHSFEIWQVIEWHKRLGFSTLILGLLSASWRIAKKDQLAPRVRLITMLLEVALVGTLSWGAHLGGRLVYDFGVGGTFGVR
jgi:uncharacterized membrane protein